MELKLLNREEITEIYYSRMTEDFPKTELKRLDHIMRMIDEGIYECYDLMDGKNCAAYICMVKLPVNGRDCYLCDYLAVDSSIRDRGIGTLLLQTMKDSFKDAECVIGEVENPAYAESEEERMTMERRIAFYERSGVRKTGLSLFLFDVEYLVMEIPCFRSHTEEESYEIMDAFYRRIIPEHLYEKNLVYHLKDR